MPDPVHRSSTTRLPGSLLGGFLTVCGWALFEASSWGVRLVIAVIGFALGRGILYGVRRLAPSLDRPATAAETRRTESPHALLELVAFTVLAAGLLLLGYALVPKRPASLPDLPPLPRLPDPPPDPPVAPTLPWSSQRVTEVATGPRDASVTGVINDRPVAFRWATATMSGEGLRVQLRTEPAPACDLASPLGTSAFSAELLLPPGPGGTNFVGHDVGVEVRLAGAVEPGHTRIGDRPVFPDRVTVRVDPFDRRPGAHIHGTVALDDGWTRLEGSFDTTLCMSWDPRDVLPDRAEPGLVAGRIAGKSFTSLSAVAVLETHARGKIKAITEVRFYPHAGVTCAQARESDFTFKPYALYVDRIGGGASDHALVGTMQPASGGVYVLEGEALHFAGARRAWVRWDTLAFKQGARVRGTVYAAGNPSILHGSFEGSFDALVCAW
jgi:hypothetical protein